MLPNIRRSRWVKNPPGLPGGKSVYRYQNTNTMEDNSIYYIDMEVLYREVIYYLINLKPIFLLNFRKYVKILAF